MHNMYLHGNGMSSFIHQTVIMQSSDSHQTVIRQSSDSHQTVIRQSSDSHQTVIRQSSDSHQTVILIHLILSGLELHCTLYYITVTSRYTEALKLHCFLKKNLLYYIGINLTKCGFELHDFFLKPKTAYLEALLYLYVTIKFCSFRYLLHRNFALYFLRTEVFVPKFPL
jgi:hypothetical protein